jgi:threonine synthase
MDILISSNLERLLYFTSDATETTKYMTALAKDGKYTVSSEIKSKIDENFVGYCADESETAKTLNKYFNEYNYLADTHTSVALCCAEKYISAHNDTKKMIVASTASPYKFAIDVYRSLYHAEPTDALSALDELSAKTGTSIPYPLCGIGERSVRFTDVVPSADMWKAVQKYLG